jgi:hypothetical protein
MKILKSKMTLIFLIVSFFTILIFFQNCGKVKFDALKTSSKETPTSTGTGGTTGSSGVTGTTGDFGTTGTTGSSGSTGGTGLTGTTGSLGSSGTTGSSGSTGGNGSPGTCFNGASDYPACVLCPAGNALCEDYANAILACYGYTGTGDWSLSWGSYSSSSTFIPFVPLVTPNVPATCSNGIELNNLYASVYQLNANAPTPIRQAWIDYGTYEVPDSLSISSINGAGVKTEIFNKSKISTHANPYTTVNRPPDDRLRQAQLIIPAGTVKLEFNFSRACSPFYIRLQGLCDFNRSKLIPTSNSIFTYAGEVRLFPEGTVIPHQ